MATVDCQTLAINSPLGSKQLAYVQMSHILKLIKGHRQGVNIRFILYCSHLLLGLHAQLGYSKFNVYSSMVLCDNHTLQLLIFIIQITLTVE